MTSVPLQVGKANTGLKKKIAEFAKQSSFNHHEDRMKGLPGNSLAYKVGITHLHLRI